MRVGYQIKSNNVKTAYEKLIPLIFTFGSKVITEDNQKTLELLDCTVIINNPMYHISSLTGDVCNIPELYPLGENAVKKYVSQLFYGTDNEFSYDYHSRLFNWKGNVNQINNIIEKLQKSINSRRAVAITWYPDKDIFNNYVPCLQYIQFLVRNKELFMKVLFRSNDALLGFPANAIGLIRLGKYVADRLNVRLSKYSHTAVSMHIYYERDKDYLKKYFPECYKLLGTVIKE